MPQAIFHLSFPVRSLQAAKDFYCTYLGASIGRDNREWADIILFGHQVTLHERPSEVLSLEMGGVRHFGAILPWEQWQALVDRLSSLGCPLHSGPTLAHPGTASEQAKIVLRDPSDNLVEIKAYRNMSAAIGGPAAAMPDAGDGA